MSYIIKIAILASLAAASVRAGENPPPVANATNRFSIRGMSCDGCARGIQSELKAVPGVLAAEVSFSNKVAVAIYDTNQTTVDGLRKVIVDAGYRAKLIKPGTAKKR